MTAAEIADWMLGEFETRRTLYQSRVANFVRQHNPDLVYRNKQRNWALDKSILAAFRKITSDDVVWSRSQQLWRKRTERDKPGRMQR